MKIGIAGCTGRMGQLLVKEVQNASDLYLAGGVTRDKDMLPENVPILKDGEDLFAVSDLVIDFTAPDASVRHARMAASAKKPLLIGTTGISESQMADIKDAAQNAPILYTPNSSLGVNILMQFVKKAAKILGTDYAIEILEAHHGKKVDAPSGTALALGKSAAEGRGISLSSKAVYDRHGHTGARTKDEIGFSVIRGGDIVGEHTVMFLGTGERIELTHKATDRALFARGALQAARWLIDQPAGFYNMNDFLKLD
ncbi:MAG TPA: 4-hydroxy-tetrahydrodipicolinate reductase [Alphaproteobacteria bacterium]|nr:4-hydroxy-tetrahydrodipicolinate reductase [Alphaproteobacteria bacterium]HOO52284.1 4-hydroxy-tetrahydrodipicolinate reductase [Alphaproteobacteria bacterium]